MDHRGHRLIEDDLVKFVKDNGASIVGSGVFSSIGTATNSTFLNSLKTSSTVSKFDSIHIIKSYGAKFFFLELSFLLCKNIQEN